MQVLTVDIGTGTQDIYLFRSGLSLENGYKIVAPSPTMLIRRQIQNATRRGEALLLTGVTMGGGPCHWAAEAHLRAGYKMFATPEAALTFNDDLAWVRREMGVEVVSEDEAVKLDHVRHIKLLDFDFDAIARAFIAFEVNLNLQAVAVAVFDHGAAPPDISDRQFRFDYLMARIQSENRLSAFAYPSNDLPSIMTRMQAVVKSAAGLDCPLVVMDTAPAAVLGATLDPRVAARSRVLITNIGNFHTLAFRLGPAGIEGVFEHHTGLIDLPHLEALLQALADGSLTHQEVFDDHGHGALILHPEPLPLTEDDFGTVVTGPRRSMMRGSRLRPHFAVPYGDMMLTGCFGLLASVAEHVQELSGPIRAALAGAGAESAPWDVEG
ncbi:MAG: pyruvate formate lyase-activating protein [Anaerolineales bacterium]|nr:MAG: pyruvate formate lyase-activating protein [Anaerolineales bacterium]